MSARPPELRCLIAAGGTARLIYTVQMPSTAGSYTNSAWAVFGTATHFIDVVQYLNGDERPTVDDRSDRARHVMNRAARSDDPERPRR